jgi:hypothetical protein
MAATGIAKMPTNLERYKADIDKLVVSGTELLMSMAIAVNPKRKKELGLTDESAKQLPHVEHEYQRWYSEALACVEQLLPARVQDFVNYYKPDKARKDITYANYTVSDYLKGLTVTRTMGIQKDTVVGPDATLHALQQQVQIVTATRQRLESSLFDIRAIVQADLFDNELDAAEELNRKGFERGAGAIAGVVLESHLTTIAKHHKLTHGKNPSIADLNDLLKKHDVVDVPTWRFIQRLGDLRNLCDHKKSLDPTKENVSELIEGTKRIIKSIL